MDAKTEQLGDTDPLWYKDAIIYQLHVKAFFDGNGDGIGDFPGLIAKLDYIADLGVNALWLLPFYPVAAARRRLRYPPIFDERSSGLRHDRDVRQFRRRSASARPAGNH